MNTILLGDYNDLTMTRFATRENPHASGGVETFGIFLDGGPEGEILMPKRYVPQGIQPGDKVHCMVYLDQDERLVATTETARAVVGQVAWLRCAWVNQHGAFLDWGLMKDLFCPFGEQRQRMEVGEFYLVYIYVDRDSYRIAASAKIERFLARHRPDYRPGEEVSLVVWQTSPLGFKVVVDDAFAGLVYRDQVFRPVHLGDRLTGYVQQVRPDGKVDVALQPSGRRQTEDCATALLEWMQAHDGHCPMHDGSHPDDIKRLFHVSKKVFKRAVGDLYKRRLIVIEADGLHLV